MKNIDEIMEDIWNKIQGLYLTTGVILGILTLVEILGENDFGDIGQAQMLGLVMLFGVFGAFGWLPIFIACLIINL